MTWNPHITVAAVCERNGKFLIIEELSAGELVFNQPAGHLDPNESLIDAVIRETREESAWRFTPTALLGLYLWQQPDNGETILRVAFIGDCDDHRADQPLDTGIERALWFSRDELVRSDRLRSPLVLQSIDDYLGGQRLPLSAVVDALPRSADLAVAAE